jgi:methionyl-tRNA formyltransferase
MARLAFLGTPAIAVPPLQGLLEAGHDIDLVITRPDARRGRGSAQSASPVKQAALEAGLRVSHDLADFDPQQFDAAVVVAYGALLAKDLVEAIPMLNLHFSDLPRWRGAAPVERAILAGDPSIAVCVMQIVEALDAGGVYAKGEIPSGNATLEELWQSLSILGTSLLVGVLDGGVANLPPAMRQEGEVTYAKKITVEDRHLNFAGSAEQALRQIRVGRAWTTIEGERFMVLSAALGETQNLEPGQVDGVSLGFASGSLRLEMVQAAGRAAMRAEDWKRGQGSGVTQMDFAASSDL